MLNQIVDKYEPYKEINSIKLVYKLMTVSVVYHGELECHGKCNNGACLHFLEIHTLYILPYVLETPPLLCNLISKHTLHFGKAKTAYQLQFVVV